MLEFLLANEDPCNPNQGWFYVIQEFFLALLLDFRSIAILQETYHWEKLITKLIQLKKYTIDTHTCIFQKLGIIGSWERWPCVLFLTTLNKILVWIW